MRRRTPMKPSDRGNNLDTRVGRLEGAVETLIQNEQEIARNVKDIAHAVTIFKEEILSKIGTATAPRWPLILGFATLILTVVGFSIGLLTFLLSGQSGMITENKVAVKTLSDKLYDTRYEDGRADTWRENATKTLVDLDTKLQREMSLLNEASSSRAKAVEERFQREFTIIDKALSDRVYEILSQLTDLRKWRLEHEESDSKVHGQTSTSIEYINDMLRKIEERQYNDRVNRLGCLECEKAKRTVDKK